MYLSCGEHRPIDAADRAPLPADADSFAVVWADLGHEDSQVHLRAADAIERASRDRPELLQPYKNDLIHPVLDGKSGFCWHLVAVSARLELDSDEAARLMRRLEDAVFNDPSGEVQAEALVTAFALAARHRRLALRARDLAKHALNHTAPAVADRARRLLAGG
jgi:hypothetical protein